MARNEINPYESPQSAAAEPGNRTGNPLVGTVLRVVIMGLIGFASFSAVGFLYFGLAEYFQLEVFPSPAWALAVGTLGAVIFLSSELFNSDNGKKAGFLRRFIVTLVVFLVSAVISSSITTQLGWNPPPYRSQQSDPYWIHSPLTFCCVLIAALFTVRLSWIPRQGALEPKW